MPQRNAEAASAPHLSVAGRPYTLNGREERAPGVGTGASERWGVVNFTPPNFSPNCTMTIHIIGIAVWQTVL